MQINLSSGIRQGRSEYGNHLMKLRRTVAFAPGIHCLLPHNQHSLDTCTRSQIVIRILNQLIKKADGVGKILLADSFVQTMNPCQVFPG